jgi:hypothetical protein
MRAAACLAITALVAVAPVQAQGTPEPAVFLDNQPTDPGVTGVELLMSENALLTRLPDRIVIDVRMKTPEPGSYRYDPTIPEELRTAPEVFTGWLFVFNHPEHCTTFPVPPRCGPDDFVEATRPGVYNFAGHVSSITHHGGAFVLDEASGGYIILQGEILVGQEPLQYMPPRVDVHIPLEQPLTAEIHVAIVSHGQIVTTKLPGDLYDPYGMPTCGCWWLAMWPGAPGS